jgi:hypothetical protein
MTANTHDLLEGFGRDAEAFRHADPFEPGKLPQVRAFPPDRPDVGSVDLLEAKHIRTHLFISFSRSWSRGRTLPM